MEKPTDRTKAFSALILACGLLAACGGNNEKSPDGPGPPFKAPRVESGEPYQGAGHGTDEKSPGYGGQRPRSEAPDSSSPAQ